MIKEKELVHSVNGGSIPESVAPIAGAGLVLLERTWEANAGIHVRVDLRIVLQGDAAMLSLKVGVGAANALFNVPITSNNIVLLQIPVVGHLHVSISGLERRADLLAFNLRLTMVPLFFLPPIDVAYEHFVLPIPQHHLLGGGSAPQTLAEYATLLDLAARTSPVNPKPVPRPWTAPKPVEGTSGGAQGETILIAKSMDVGGRIYVGPNWREDRPMFFRLPVDFRRDYVNVRMVEGGLGHAEFVRWLSDDPSDGSFLIHIGTPFWFGGGEVSWEVYGHSIR